MAISCTVPSSWRLCMSFGTLYVWTAGTRLMLRSWSKLVVSKLWTQIWCELQCIYLGCSAKIILEWKTCWKICVANVWKATNWIGRWTKTLSPLSRLCVNRLRIVLRSRCSSLPLWLTCGCPTVKELRRGWIECRCNEKLWLWFQLQRHLDWTDGNSNPLYCPNPSLLFGCTVLKLEIYLNAKQADGPARITHWSIVR